MVQEMQCFGSVAGDNADQGNIHCHSSILETFVTRWTCQIGWKSLKNQNAKYQFTDNRNIRTLGKDEMTWNCHQMGIDVWTIFLLFIYSVHGIRRIIRP